MRTRTGATGREPGRGSGRLSAACAVLPALLLGAVLSRPAWAETVSTTALTLVANANRQATALTNRLTGTSWITANSSLFTLGGDAGLTGTLTLIPLSGGEIQLTLTITNPASTSLTATPSFPVLQNLNPGTSYGTVAYCFPQLGKAGNTAANNSLNKYYGGGFPLQFMDVYDGSAGGIYVMTHDLSNAERIYRLSKGSASVALSVDYTSQELAAHGTWVLTAVVGAHTGDWHAALTAYQNWVKTWYSPTLPRKTWFQDSYNFREVFLYTNTAVGATPAYDPNTQTYFFDTLLAQDRAAFGGIDYVHLFDWSQTPAYGRCGDYNPWSYLGGAAAFSNQVARIQASGSPVGLYFEGYLLDKKSLIAQSSGTNWQLLDNTGSPYDNFGSGYNYACPTVPDWVNYLAGRTADAMQQSAANGVYLDEFGFGWQYFCYNPAHSHPAPSQQLQAEAAMVQQIRQALPPETALYTEERGTDVTSQYQDGSFTYAISNANTNDNPSRVNLARFALPDFKVFEIIRVDQPLGNDPASVKAIFFNGEGIWLEGPVNDTWFPAAVCQVITKTYGLLRTYRDAFRSTSPVPLVPTLNTNLYANQFPGSGKTVWTLLNVSTQALTGELLMVTHKANAHYYDAWNGQPLTPRISGNSAYLTLNIAAQDAGCVVQVTNYPSTVLADSPVGYWRLDETVSPGSTATNLGSLGAAGNGTYFAGVAGGQPGAVTNDTDTAAGFDGVSGKLEVPYNAALNATPFSLECWAKPGFLAATDYAAVVSARVPDPEAGYTFYVPPNSTNSQWQFWTGNGGNWNVQLGPLLASNQWTHLVGTYDGTNQSFYVNGALAASAPLAFTPNPSSLLRIGAGGSDTNSLYCFNGTIDELAVYTNALSPSQVVTHYTAGAGGAPPPVLPAFQLNPQSQPAFIGQSAAFSAQAIGSLPLAYQWQCYRTNLPAQTNPSLLLTNVTLANAGPYQVIVTNAAGAATSSVATLSVGTLSGSYRNVILGDSPVGYWRLDETNGTTAYNLGSLGSAANGTYTNGVTLAQPGAVPGDPDYCAAFTATNAASVNVPYSAALNSSQFTVECWARITGPGRTADAPYQSPLTSRQNSGPAGYMFYGLYGTTWQFWLGNGAGGYTKLAGPSVQVGAWAYLAATFDGTTARFYVNGFPAASAGSAIIANQAAVLRIGGGATDTFPGAYFLQGNVDEVAVYSKVLAPTAILAHYSAGLGLWVSVQRTPSTTLLIWSGGTLQATGQITGPWTNVNAISPADLGPSPPGTAYYRVKH